jgi:hypothetical protein
MRLGSGIKLSRDITRRHTTIPAAKLDELYGRTPTPGLGLRQPNSYTYKICLMRHLALSRRFPYLILSCINTAKKS